MTSILTANDSQFKLFDDGTIRYQALLNNPLPGEAVAHITKGDTALSPVIALNEGQDEELKIILQGWLARHIALTLAPLKNLKITGQALPDPVQTICDQLFEQLGVIHRTELQDAISQLDEDMRVPIRDKKIKMGPVLIFLPELNKPAAVRLKAVLYSVYNEKPLPAPTPNDGVVSAAIDPENVDRNFFRVIGYPVFGPRAIRIDMLDRVINSIYDTAAEGKFQAKHQMAEWLGVSIDDLYAIIRAMGHKQIKTNTPDQDASPQESPPEDTTTAPAPSDEIKPEESKEPKKPIALDWFWIKSGKASDKPQRKKADQNKGKKNKDKPVRNAKKKAKIHSKKGKDEPKVFTFDAKEDKSDNPFAALEALKKL